MEQDAEGLLQAYSLKCQHGHSAPCGAIPERFYMTFPLAVHDFSKQKWPETPLSTVLSLLKGPLQGLKVLHEAGYMHRDVSAKNLLVMSLEPPKAVLCDYGKSRQAAWHTDTRIGPIPTLAPEVTGHSRYDSKIDIWGLGYVCCWILFPEFQLRNADGVRPDRNWHKGAMAQIADYERLGGPSERSFADLVRQMLAWAPTNRITAAQALQHPCMQPDSTPSISSSDSEERNPILTKFPRIAHSGPIAPEAANTPAPGTTDQMHHYHSGDTEVASQ